MLSFPGFFSLFAVLLVYDTETYCFTSSIFCRSYIYLCIGMKVESSILVLDLLMR